MRRTGALLQRGCGERVSDSTGRPIRDLGLKLDHALYEPVLNNGHWIKIRGPEFNEAEINLLPSMSDQRSTMLDAKTPPRSNRVRTLWIQRPRPVFLYVAGLKRRRPDPAAEDTSPPNGPAIPRTHTQLGRQHTRRSPCRTQSWHPYPL